MQIVPSEVYKKWNLRVVHRAFGNRSLEVLSISARQVGSATSCKLQAVWCCSTVRQAKVGTGKLSIILCMALQH